MSEQEQVAGTFDKLWNSIYDFDTFSSNDLGIPNDNQKILDWSDGLIPKWIHSVSSKKSTIKCLDAGCGLGYGIKSILETCRNELAHLRSFHYHGIDLIDLSKTESNVGLFAKATLPNAEVDILLDQIDMNDLSNSDNRYDIVLALGSLHHTPSVQRSLATTFQQLKTGGVYIGWVINEQKPLRACTDKYFRNFFSSSTSKDHCEHELDSLAFIFHALGQALGDRTVTINNTVHSLDLKPGVYKLQTILYDYVLKCYYKGGEYNEGLVRVKAQLYDWFLPKYYHQTSREELINILLKIPGCSEVEIVTKVNGHFFKATNINPQV